MNYPLVPILGILFSGAITLIVAATAVVRSRRDGRQAPGPTPPPTAASPGQNLEAALPPNLHPISSPRKHTVVAGESLWSIAEQYYGDGNRFREIAAASNIPNPESITIEAAKRPARTSVFLVTTEQDRTVEEASMDDLEEIHAAVEAAMSARATPQRRI